MSLIQPPLVTPGWWGNGSWQPVSPTQNGLADSLLMRAYGAAKTWWKVCHSVGSLKPSHPTRSTRRRRGNSPRSYGPHPLRTARQWR